MTVVVGAVTVVVLRQEKNVLYTVLVAMIGTLLICWGISDPKLHGSLALEVMVQFKRTRSAIYGSALLAAAVIDGLVRLAYRSFFS